MHILYEDNHIIAIEKTPGRLTQGDSTGDISLLEEVREYIRKRDNKPGNVFLGLVHRLDRPVGGVLIFAKTSKGASRISEQIREGTIEKIYEALVEGTPPTSGTVHQWLRKDTVKNYVHAHDHPVRGGLEATLEYSVIESGPRSRVAIHPLTGRPHQIRVAMASIGTPIVGDTKYGNSKSTEQLSLWAASYSFIHPTTHEEITITSTPPWAT